LVRIRVDESAAESVILMLNAQMGFNRAIKPLDTRSHLINHSTWQGEYLQVVFIIQNGRQRPWSRIAAPGSQTPERK